MFMSAVFFIFSCELQPTNNIIIDVNTSFGSTGDSEMIRFIILNNFIFSSFPYSYIVVDLTFSDYLIVCIPLANIGILFHPAKRITIYIGLSFTANKITSMYIQRNGSFQLRYVLIFKVFL